MRVRSGVVLAFLLVAAAAVGPAAVAAQPVWIPVIDYPTYST